MKEKARVIILGPKNADSDCLSNNERPTKTKHVAVLGVMGTNPGTMLFKIGLSKNQPQSVKNPRRRIIMLVTLEKNLKAEMKRTSLSLTID
jgi:hypothetical protein